MLRNLKTKLILFLLCVVACTLLPACSVGEKSFKDFKENLDLQVQITYYANYGMFDETSDLKVKDHYTTANSCAYEIKEQGLKNRIKRTGYVLVGWETVELDQDGNPVYLDQENKVVKSTGEAFDFSTKLQKGEHIHLCAVWVKDVVLEYVLITDNPISVKVTEGETTSTKTFNNKAVINEETFGSGTYIELSDKEPIKSTDSTYLHLYKDEQCTIPFFVNDNGKRVDKPENGENAKVYAKYVQGVYTVVKNATGVQNMFSSLGYGSFYLFSPSGENVIDCSSLNLAPSAITACLIEGNGITLKNLTFKQEQITSGSTCAMLGNVTPTAKIKNLTLENVLITYGIKTLPQVFVNLYAVTSTVDLDATFENFVIDTIKVRIEKNSTPSLTINNDLEKNLLFGNVTEDSQFTLITVTNATYEEVA